MEVVRCVSAHGAGGRTHRRSPPRGSIRDKSEAALGRAVDATPPSRRSGVHGDVGCVLRWPRRAVRRRTSQTLSTRNGARITLWHFAFCWAKSGDYVTQVSAIGPLGLEYHDAADAKVLIRPMSPARAHSTSTVSMANGRTASMRTTGALAMRRLVMPAADEWRLPVSVTILTQVVLAFIYLPVAQSFPMFCGNHEKFSTHIRLRGRLMHKTPCVVGDNACPRVPIRKAIRREPPQVCGPVTDTAAMTACNTRVTSSSRQKHRSAI
jgi:hypothetical protein